MQKLPPPVNRVEQNYRYSLSEKFGELRLKDYITIAMGSSNRGKAKNACAGEGIANEMFDAIEAAVLKRYPKLSLYTGFGVNAQSLEGQILKQVILLSTNEVRGD